MLTATCHCGAIKVAVPRRPRSLTACNCSICRRYGTLWAYYKRSEVRVNSAAGATSNYVWGDRSLAFVRCSTCGCVTHWQRTGLTKTDRMGVNARNFEPLSIKTVRIRRLDGASTWKYLE